MPERPQSRSREWDASIYHRISAPQLGWGRKLLARLKLRGDELLLDAGCGSGRLTAELLERIPQGRVVAVDLSRNMLGQARGHLEPQFASRVRFVAADLMDLPFANTFDGIFSTAVFHWVPNHDRLFRSLYGALRPGGWLRAQCGGAGNLERVRGHVSALFRLPQYAPFFAGYKEPWVFADPESAAQRMHRAGFVDVETGLEPAPTNLNEAQHFREYVAHVTLHRHLEKLPEDRLRQEFLDALVERVAGDDPPFFMDYQRLNLVARKPA